MLGFSGVTTTAWFRSLYAGLGGRSTRETDDEGGRLEFRDLPLAARSWTALVIATYVAAVVWAAPHARPIVLTALIPTLVVSAAKRWPNPQGGMKVPNSGVIVAAALMWTPPEVLVAIGIGSFVGERVWRRVEWWRDVGNATSWGLAGGVTAVLVQSVTSALAPGTVRNVTSASVAALAYFIVNRAMFSVTRSYRFRRPFLSEWRHSLYDWPQELFGLPALVGIAAVAYSLNDLAWSLAVAMATTLLSPLDAWIGRFSLGMIMQRRASAALWQNETQFRALVKYLSEGISLVNAEGTILYLSPSALQILGDQNSRHVGRSWFEMHHPEDSERLKASFSSVVRDPGSHFTAETRMLHRDGSWRWILTAHTNLLMEPSIRAIVVTYHDITQARRSEETLEEYAARLEDLSRRLVQTQEMERRKIAQELHDETGQILTGLKLMLDVVIKQVGESEARSTLARAAAMLETLNEHVRTLSLNLRPAALDDLGLLPAVLLLCNQYTAQTSVEVKVTHTGISGRRFAAEIETTAYRIIQEGLTNVARHANVAEVTIRLWADEEILGIQLEDCGKGFDIEALKAVDQSRGISGMRERAYLVGGEFSIESTPGAGTRLTAELPFRRSRAAVAVTHGS